MLFFDLCLPSHRRVSKAHVHGILLFPNQDDKEKKFQEVLFFQLQKMWRGFCCVAFVASILLVPDKSSELRSGAKKCCPKEAKRLFCFCLLKFF
jgi:hypothetical protein